MKTYCIYFCNIWVVLNSWFMVLTKFKKQIEMEINRRFWRSKFLLEIKLLLFLITTWKNPRPCYKVGVNANFVHLEFASNNASITGQSQRRTPGSGLQVLQNSISNRSILSSLNVNITHLSPSLYALKWFHRLYM